MKDLYLISEISKQGHSQALDREAKLLLKEPVYIGLMDQIREFHPGMGLRTMYEQFEPEGIGRDRFISLGLREGFRLQLFQSPIKTTRGHPGRGYRNLLEKIELTDVNQVWVSDLTYYQLEEGYHYIVLLMDLYSRRIIGYSGANNMRASNNISALKMALTLRGIKHYKNQLIHHSDRGSQYTSDDYTDLLQNRGIQISMCSNVLENAHCERVNGTIKNDYLQKWNVKSKAKFYRKLHNAVDNYNNRNHRSLQKMTPIKFENHLKNIDPENRIPMSVFTLDKSIPNPDQLNLFN